MRVPLSWLREMVPAAPHDPEAVGSALTLLGVELDVIESPPATPSGVYAARVLEKREIEGARACFVVVDAGPFGVREVVCGAHNFGPGDLLPLALPGARLPNGMEIARREVRLPLGPVVSDGMLCAPDELALSDDHSGIHHLDRGEPGTDVRALLGLDEWVLVFEITPNRPDAMSMAGLARELAAVFGGPLNLPAVQPLLAPDSFPVDIADAGLCPRYVAIAVDGVTIGPSPIDVQHRLRAAGVRPINNVVDATNYVLMERGQPLHAFDLSLLAGPRIAVRPAVDGERITTLDGTERMLEQGDILICDAARPVALGGIMGGADTEVTGATSRILIESAMFLSTSILQTSKRLGLRSEASARFERGGDPEQTLEAAMRCADLIEAWSGGRRVAVTDRCPVPAVRRRIPVRPDRINHLLGTSIAPDDQRALLRRVDIPAAPTPTGYDVEVPGRRPDMEREADVAEEVARLFGYNRIGRTLPGGSLRIGTRTPTQIRRRRLLDVLVGLGLTEVQTWSFAGAAELDACGLGGLPRVAVLNPLNAEQSLMRPSVLPGLLRVARTNVGRRRSDLSLFEIGTVFAPAVGADEVLPREHQELGILLAGRASPPGPHEAARPVDVFDVKGLVEEIVAAMDIERVTVDPGAIAGLHPGRSGRVMIDGADAGFIGELHPAVARRYDLDRGAVVAVLDAGGLHAERRRPPYRDLARFPEADRDINVVVGEDVPAGALAEAARSSGPLVRRVAVLDVYRGAQVGEGSKSVTISLVFGDAERTLTDPEVDDAVDAIVEDLGRAFGARLRG